ncbi:MAG: glycerol-3-phosphate dehydrogenase/oxidase [Pirellulales bacterium]|nr:glycerol-3-phosphate dehydrogenase/oxidase [Pirellulales bacterium]
MLALGGGIVGSGLARDAATRGLNVGLVEQYDFAFGTSSRSSHLLHGGLRYLAQGYIRLVHEASLEKRVVHRIAPHLADPLPFIFPTRKGWQWARWKLSIGVKLYDLLCGRRNLGKSSTLSRKALLELLPDLEPHGITGAVRYYDGLTNDARLVIDTLRSAHNNGAILANYVRFDGATYQDGLWHCRAVDQITGQPLEIRATQVVNATGPWSDKIANSATDLRLTKGVHLVIDRKRLPIPDAVVMTEGSRILFGIPWGERVILGTTDTDYDGPLETPDCNEEDISYILDVVAVLFPRAKITPDDIISTWSGLRPLVADPHGNPSDISRRHEIKMAQPGWWDVTGGKLTTYRLMSEQAIDRVVKHAGLDVQPCRTATEPLLEKSQTDGLSSVVPQEVTERAVRHFCRNEWARSLEDVMVRRTYWSYYHRNHAEIARQILPWVAEELGWNEETAQAELTKYLDEHGNKPSQSKAADASEVS